ncbi:glycosyltransferase family 2 protein [Pantanalinema rosaneae CENA516]|uniref:glycosyltransferase family 2 protein n=1 Tax=Pantanalinema rosaneae TaxID=1620701 RepID=UPI003D6EE9FD
MVQKESVFIIIPVYNRRQITLDCLATLQQTGDLDRYRVIVVDDGSTDGSATAIRDRFPDVIILTGDGNLWWTGAMVKGMNYAVEQGADYIIWLNDDCVPTANTLSTMVNYCRQYPQTITGAACYLTDTNTLHVSGAKGRQRVAAKPGEGVTVDEMSGHCVCLPTTVIQQIGLPNWHRFPHYHGDSMYLLRATRSGFTACILGDAKISHAGVIKSQIQDFLSPEPRSLIGDFQTLFLHKKSFYFLPTQFFYYLEKYGLWQGIPMFGMKCGWWFIQLIKCHLTQPRSQPLAEN